MSQDFSEVYPGLSQTPDMANFVKAPVDTGRKLNLHKKFRRPPGRLL